MTDKITIEPIAPLRVSGARNVLYLIPKQEISADKAHVRLASIVGLGEPIQAMTHHWVSLGVIPHDAVPSSVEKVLGAYEDAIAALAELYRGHGKWESHPEWLLVQLDCLSHDLTSDVAKYWAAGDYFWPAMRELRRDVVAWEGERDAFIANEISEALSNDVHLEAADVEQTIVCDLREWLEKHPDAEDDDEAKAKMRARAIEWTADR